MPDPAPRRVLGEEECRQLLASARLLQSDNHGPKVYRLADGRVLKLFRVKRLWSSNLWSPYARRFVRNAERLTRLGFPTIRPVAWGPAPSLRRQFALYEYLEGRPVRELLADPASAPETARQIGALVGTLHRQGVLFRAVHLGNLILPPEGESLGLIDVMCIRFRAGGRPLSAAQRRRNFRHVCRYAEDHAMLERQERSLRSGYERGLGRPVPESEWKRLFPPAV